MDTPGQKYITRCFERKSGKLLLFRTFNSINESEARISAYSNCLSSNCDQDVSYDSDIENYMPGKDNIRIDVQMV